MAVHRLVSRITVAALLAVSQGCGTERNDPAGLDKGVTSAVPVDEETGAGGEGGGLPCDIERLLASQCALCHDRAGTELAPMPLRSRADLLSEAPSDPATSVAAASIVRMRDHARPMPPSGMLAEADVARFEQWVRDGLPAATCTEAPSATVSPFQPVPVFSYVAKVKNLLTALPPTPEELALVTRDPDALARLVTAWTTTEAFEQKLLAFFQIAFQQADLTPAGLVDQVRAQLNAEPRVLALLVESLEQSFARTALAIVKEGRPFTDTLTTRRFMLTPALLSFLLLLDERHVDDAGKVTQPKRSFDVRTEGAAIPFADSIDPESPSFMHFSAIGATNGCATTTRRATNDIDLFALLAGRTPRAEGCGSSSTTPLLTDEDLTSFRMVSLQPGAPGAARPAFYDLSQLRQLREISLATPRIGFFTTPAFFANWSTNDSNQLRVTANQTLIVALGASFDGSDSTVPITDSGLTPDHAGPETACYACHKGLDPMRMFFKQALTLGYRDQRDPKLTGASGALVHGGVNVQGRGLDVLATALAAHPTFASAWTQKLCFYANAAPCAPDDPEFGRIATAFQRSGYDFLTLVRELFSSPLVTAARHTRTFDRRDPIVSIARQDHLCTALARRLDIADPCGLAAGASSKLQKDAQGVVASIPRDTYSRGSELPVTLSDTSLFHRGAVEELCSAIANAVVDVGASSKYESARLEQALSDFVHGIMALAPGDPRAPGALAILRGHHQDVLAQKATAAAALRSTFVLACTSPSSITIGL